MYGKDVRVKFNGKIVEVFVSCTPDTLYSELKERVIIILEARKRQVREKEFKWLLQIMK